MLDNLYENIGGKIKNWAKWIFIVEAIGAIITGLVLLFTDEDLILYGLLTLVCGPIVAYVGSWILYAFGQLVEDTHAMRNKEGTTQEVKDKAMREAEEKARREAEERARREAEEKAKREEEFARYRAERARRRAEAEKKERSATNKEIIIAAVDTSNNFEINDKWKADISKLSTDEIVKRYCDVESWAEEYRHHCYLELKSRNISKYEVAQQNSAENNSVDFVINPKGTGYICPVCNANNEYFSKCVRCGYTPSIDVDGEVDSEDSFISVTCPNCRKDLSFVTNEATAVCPWCDTEIYL